MAISNIMVERVCACVSSEISFRIETSLCLSNADQNGADERELVRIAVDVNQTVLYQNWTVELLIADTCTVEPFVSGEYIGWIQFQTLPKPKQYLCPAFAIPFPSLVSTNADGTDSRTEACDS
uniref:Uncharacterized protein n=1 Tax=Proboscia inermis TaxID=420281 RepID=A0A7S0CM19_9STRA|mmetsp:Transcript_52589/g.52962  ORF Transcript_52589/g.52962 Transcript_52589/m.52962 type:complete len:123 (+) Transcript_52589:72-440(+)